MEDRFYYNLLKPDSKGQEPYNFIMWDIKQKAANKNPHGHRQQNGGWGGGGQGEVEEGKQGQVHSDGRRLDFGW